MVSFLIYQIFQAYRNLIYSIILVLKKFNSLQTLIDLHI
nr:MAG TPA: hypothetical protein [Caudoviricetes sp.]